MVDFSDRERERERNDENVCVLREQIYHCHCLIHSQNKNKYNLKIPKFKVETEQKKNSLDFYGAHCWSGHGPQHQFLARCMPIEICRPNYKNHKINYPLFSNSIKALPATSWCGGRNGVIELFQITYIFLLRDGTKFRIIH